MMRKLIAKIKELALSLGFGLIAKNCNSKSTNDELFGYIVLMCNYMMSLEVCTDEMRTKIMNGLKMVVFSLNIQTNSNYKLAA